jgi:hypothetical protein
VLEMPLDKTPFFCVEILLNVENFDTKKLSFILCLLLMKQIVAMGQIIE